MQLSLNLGFCACSNPARGVSGIRDGEALWQWSRLEIRLNAIRRSTIPQKQFINSSRINNWTIFYLTWFDLVLSFYFLTSRFFYKSIIKIYVNNSCCFVSDIGLCRKKNVDLHESRSWSLWITGKNTKVDIVDLGSFIKRQTSGRYIEWQRVVQRVKTNDNQLYGVVQRVTTNDNEWPFRLIFLFLK